jgi:hypothetical protein
MLIPSPYESSVFNSTWDVNRTDGSATYTLSQRRFFGYYVEGGASSDPSDIFVLPGETSPTILLAAETKVLTCQPRSVLYDLNMTYIKGFQNVKYSTSNSRPLRLFGNGMFLAMDTNSTHGQSPTLLGKDYPQWPDKLKNTLDEWSVFAPLDAMMQNMEYTWNITSPLQFDKSAGEFKLANGTTVKLQAVGLSDVMGYDSRFLPFLALKLRELIHRSRWE